MPFNPYVRVTKDVVAELLRDRQPEDRTLEYKQATPGTSVDDRNEFLADVTAMANTAGGVILYGVEEERVEGEATARPKSVCGLPGVNVVEQRHRMEQWLKSNVAPNIPGVHLYAVEGAADAPILVVQTPRSWCSPHLVKNGRWSGFFNRGSVGKQEMDWQAIRGAFIAGEGERERIERFRNDRIGKIVVEETPVPMSGRGRIILHVVPLGTVGGRARVAIRDTTAFAGRVTPMSARSDRASHVFEGVLTNGTAAGYAESPSYALLFREGMIEAVLGGIVNTANGAPPMINGTDLERSIRLALGRYIAEVRLHGLSPPVFVMISACGLREAKLCEAAFTERTGHAIDRDVLMMPPVVIDEFEESLDGAIRPALDTLWNAAGWPKSPNFDDDDKWIGAG